MSTFFQQPQQFTVALYKAGVSTAQQLATSLEALIKTARDPSQQENLEIILGATNEAHNNLVNAGRHAWTLKSDALKVEQTVQNQSRFTPGSSK